ncbi:MULTISPECIES: hypothetical protein [Enterococcus]|uniref:hypothetical protein n=1 Tax=Enterococcus TaxID=1350 RepID=UPI001374D703|nr:MULTISPECIES: hypothetical protein [Enterococcus]KAF1301608.1 hypothetical protein BAU16_08765 [Enterococcus sp. JM9B]
MLAQSDRLLEKARTARIMYEETKAYANHGGSTIREVQYEHPYQVVIQKNHRIQQVEVRSAADQLVISFE